MFESFEDLPPEVAEALQRRQDLHEMNNENFMNSVHHFLDEMSPQHLATLNQMMTNIVASHQPPVIAGFYGGQLQAILKFKHNVCPVHGVNHADEALEEMVNEAQSSESEKEDTLLSLEDKFALHVEEILSDLEQYNLEVRMNPETRLPQYFCKNCGMAYVSIEDRALVGVDGCKGCHQKSMFG